MKFDSFILIYREDSDFIIAIARQMYINDLASINLSIKFPSLQTTIFSKTNLNNRFILQTWEVKNDFQRLAISLSQFNFTIQEDVKLSNLT